MKLDAVVSTRDSRVHMSSLMLMGIVHELTAPKGIAYIETILNQYQTLQPKRSTQTVCGRPLQGYSYHGVYQHLETLHSRHYLHKFRYGKLVHYKLTPPARRLLTTMGLIKPEPETRIAVNEYRVLSAVCPQTFRTDLPETHLAAGL